MRYLPTLCIAVFTGLYAWAAAVYPGGSPVDPNATGFSLKYNFWCHLLYENAFNGDTNLARPIAIAGMVFLCLSLMSFFLLFPRYFKTKTKITLLIRISASLSVVLCFFISSEAHDLFSTLAAVAGIIALLGVVSALFSNKMKMLGGLGILSLILLIVNIYIYFSGVLFELLPIIQKFTFLIILVWMVLCNLKFTREYSQL